ncbi:MAG: hypothetical protein NTV54_10515 [Ignavibacteriales bacterium]|nr:hypothetical protein [Ignavibacteriales bacterium]
MKRFLFLCTVVIVLYGWMAAQQQNPARDRNAEPVRLGKTSGVEDRAAGVHNASNIGLFFENRGKLYPRRVAQGPSGEFPINSGQNYIYRINPYVGVPGSVIQGRYRTDEEWEAVGGYHNAKLSMVAFSDNPATWHPTLGWPVKDATGSPVIKSDQDSYCVFNDANNSRGALGITVAQTGYAYGVKYAQNLLFFKYDVVNKSSRTYDSLYFAMYCDIDVGDVDPGGALEYTDDLLAFDKARSFVYFYDDGLTTDWTSGKTGFFGCTFLKTPMINGKEAGITDMHYYLYNDDSNNDIDTVLYGIMASKPSLYYSPIGKKYFHVRSDTNLHFDDPTLIPPAGMDLVAEIASGPYTIKPGDTLTFYTAIAAGNTLQEALASVDTARSIMLKDFVILKPPSTPTVTGIAGDRRVTIFWDDKAERTGENPAQRDFQGYRLYRSVDKGTNWSLLADYFDVVNEFTYSRNIQRSFVDTSLMNGIEYWYTVTAYDKGDSLSASLECPRGKTPGVTNLAIVTPRSEAIGRTPVRSGATMHYGQGKSNYEILVQPADIPLLANHAYDVGFTYRQRTEKGTLRTKVRAIVLDTMKLVPRSYGILFTTPSTVTITDLTTGLDVVAEKNYNRATGITYTKIQSQGFTIILNIRVEDPNPLDSAIYLPKAGDYIVLSFESYCTRDNADTVSSARPFKSGAMQTTTDGIRFSMQPPETFQNISRVGGTDLSFAATFSIGNSSALRTNRYLLSTIGKGTAAGKGFVSLSVRDSVSTVILTKDTVFAGTSITFNGITAMIDFNSNNPPLPGNSYSVDCIVSVEPSLLDRFRFSILAPTVDVQKASAEIGGIKVVPNPYVVSSLYEVEYGELRREPVRQIQFTHLPTDCAIYVFTLDANLVKTLHHNNQTGTEAWDLRAEGGREIAAGMYVFMVKSAAGEFLGRFAVIK